MTITANDYYTARNKLQENNHVAIIETEKKYAKFLVDVTFSVINDIHQDFAQAMELMPFWINYPPSQRGRAPTGTAIPWGEVGEKTIAAILAGAIARHKPEVRWPGLPFGGDLRFATEDALIHFDIKLTGPNDNPNEIVASPNQISGDGYTWINGGMLNSAETITGAKATMAFQPELPPFYILNGKILLCLTYFLKVIYIVEGLGVQPLKYLEVVAVPNGLLLFDGPNYNTIKGVLIPGKDDHTVIKKRTRVRLDPLAHMNAWRCTKIELDNSVWCIKPRLPNRANLL
jgi:hypothetical protein